LGSQAAFDWYGREFNPVFGSNSIKPAG
jgi:hypothetical protein